jgi:hypothetical protein
MKIMYGRCAIAGCALLIAGQGVVAADSAKEATFETMNCYAGPQQVITDGKGAVGFSYETVGTPMSKEGDLLYRSNIRCVGSGISIGGQLEQSGSCVVTDRDGDRFFFFYSGRNQEPGPWKILEGTGKFEGMEGSGTWAPVLMPAKPARADIIQSCNRETGHWKLK